MKAIVTMHYKPSILDDEGRAICLSLNSLGYNEVNDVRVSKQLTITIDAKNADEAFAKVDEMCKKMLVNEVMQNYDIRINE